MRWRKRGGFGCDRGEWAVEKDGERSSDDLKLK